MTMNKKNVSNFNTVWIRYDDTSSDCHQLFIKEHSLKKQEEQYPKGKTLFVLNIPPYATVESIKNTFTDSCGSVKSVTFVDSISNSNTAFKTGYIVFDKESSLTKALALPSSHTLILSTSDSPVLTGIQKWCQDYNKSIQKESDIKKTIEKYMDEYDREIEECLEEEKALEESKDSEGWTTITSRKKRGKFALARKESTIQKVQSKEEEKKHKKQLLNFYTFQIREAKKQKLAELRKKFELDKIKVEQIKLKRKFKPF